MSNYRRLEWMTWPEVGEAAAEGLVVLQPIGAIEQHGRHLPVDTDNVIVNRLCVRAAELAPIDIVVAPIIPYGFNDHNMEFPGTVSIRPSVLLEYLFDVGHSYATQGFRRLLWVNGHGSNAAIVELAARRITNETPAASGVTGSKELTTAVERQLHLRTSPHGGICHACEFETALYMHLEPSLVKMNEITDELPSGLTPYEDHDWMGGGPLKFMSWWSQRSVSGVEGSPSCATPDLGARLFEECAVMLADMAAKFRKLQLPPRSDQRPVAARAFGLTYPA